MKRFKRLFPILVLAMTASTVFSQQQIEEYKAADNLYLVGDRVFSLYYITPAGVLVIDPINEQIAAATMKSIRSHTNLPVKYVFYSHNHWDHNSGGHLYKDQGAQFISHSQARDHMAPSDKVVPVDSVWSGPNASLLLGGKTIEMAYYGPDHGEGMTVFRFVEPKAVFTVDLVVADRALYAYLPDAKPKYWLQHLYAMRKLEFDKLLMAHVRPIGSRKDLDLQIRYFEDLYAATEKAMHDGTPFFEIPTTVKLPQYEHLMYYKEWLHMNVWRILMEKTIGQ